METTIKQVNEMLEKSRKYFKAKLLAGEFEVEKQDEYHIHLKIETYVFCIWTGNPQISTGRKQYGSQGIEFSEPIDLKITDDEAKILDGVLQPIIEKYTQDVEIKRLEKRLNQLKNKEL